MDFVLYSYIKWCFCISVSNCSLLICKNTTDIFISVSHFITLINSLISSSSFLRIHLYFLHMWSCVFTSFFLLLCLLCLFLALLHQLGASGKRLIGAMRLNITVLFLIFWWKASKKFTIKHNGSCKFLVNALYQIKEVPLILIFWQLLSWIDIIFSQEIWLILLRQFFFSKLG